jgi:hypothetical protein
MRWKSSCVDLELSILLLSFFCFQSKIRKINSSLYILSPRVSLQTSCNLPSLFLFRHHASLPPYFSSGFMQLSLPVSLQTSCNSPSLFLFRLLITLPLYFSSALLQIFLSVSSQAYTRPLWLTSSHGVVPRLRSGSWVLHPRGTRVMARF